MSASRVSKGAPSLLAESLHQALDEAFNNWRYLLGCPGSVAFHSPRAGNNTLERNDVHRLLDPW